MDNTTARAATNLAMATAKAQLDEAQRRLKAAERHCASCATEALKAGIIQHQIGRESNYQGKAYRIAQTKHETASVLLDLALELLASAHGACADAHEAVRKAVEADIRSNT